MKTPASDQEEIARTREWIEQAVIGLNLCPFAKAVYSKDQICYVVSEATSPEGLLDDLERELHRLAETPRAAIETILLIHPRVLADFLGYNDFLGLAEAAVERLALAGVLQVASFHPLYQFAGTDPDDVTNHTNRSPYPTLHILREASIAEAIDAYPDIDTISAANIATMRRLHGIA